jgi:hypothetical protein
MYSTNEDAQVDRWKSPIWKAGMSAEQTSARNVSPDPQMSRADRVVQGVHPRDHSARLPAATGGENVRTIGTKRWRG